MSNGWDELADIGPAVDELVSKLSLGNKKKAEKLLAEAKEMATDADLGPAISKVASEVADLAILKIPDSGKEGAKQYAKVHYGALLLLGLAAAEVGS